MKDSEIPAFVAALLTVCKRAVKDDNWEAPNEPGTFNGHCCPLSIYAQYNRFKPILPDSDLDLAMSFMCGYDIRKGSTDHRFYVLGQTFRKLADTVGFK